jgi:hypothetical protein
MPTFAQLAGRRNRLPHQYKSSPCIGGTGLQPVTLACERFLCAFLTLCLVSCGTGKPGPPLALPAAAGPWTLAREQPIRAEEYPQVLATLGVVDARAATYTGPSPVTVHVFRMKSETVTFEALQKWRPEKGVMHFYRGPYFVLALTSERKFVDVFDKATAWRQGA